MLGRKRRTTKLDVGLAIVFVGISFLIWSLVAGVARAWMRRVIVDDGGLEELTRAVKIFFVDTGFVIDLVGLGWMMVCLVLIYFAGRQRLSISWAWATAMLQSFVASLGGVLVAGATIGVLSSEHAPRDNTLQRISQLSLPVVIAVAVVIWAGFVYFMIRTRGTMRRGPSLSDGLRTNR
jgi:ABC-type xylose transport system permease subunit